MWLGWAWFGSVGTETAEFGYARLEWVVSNSTVLGYAPPTMAVLSAAKFGPADRAQLR